MKECAELKKQTPLVKLEIFFSLLKGSDSVVAPCIVVSGKKPYGQ